MDETEKLKQELKESKAKYETLIKHLPDVIVTIDAQGHTLFISPNIKEIYGYTPEEIYENNEELWLRRIHPEDVPKVKEELELFFKGSKKLNIIYRIKRKDGEWIWFHGRSISSYEKDGKLMADGLFTDITELKETERKLKDKVDQLEEAFENIVQRELRMAELKKESAKDKDSPA